MRRTLRLVALTMTSLLPIACGGPAPTSPTRAAAAAAQATIAVALSTPPVLFGSSAVDFARCLQAAGDSGCFAGARLQTRAIGASATAPGAPINLSTSSSGSTVTLTWGAPTSGDAVTTYNIEAGSGSGLANLANFMTNNTATTFSATGIGAGTYYVRVRAQNAGGTSAASNESILVVGSTACTTAPNAPTGFAGSASGGTVTLIWIAPAAGCAPTSYVLQAGSSAGSSNLANSNVGNTTSYVATGVGNGTYYVRVLASNAYGQSAASNEFTLVVGSTAPTPPAPGLCTLSRCSSSAFNYSCGTSSYTTNSNFCIVNGRVGRASSSRFVFTNGHTVTCTYSCSGTTGQCTDDTGSSCTF